MAVSSNGSQIQQNDPFTNLYQHRFVVLTTFRKNGQAVPTTIWFAPDDAGHLYVTTNINSGKIKRIKNNSQVEMTPSNAMGHLVEGEKSVAGRARQVTAEEYAQAEATLKRKYGEEYTAFMARMGTDPSLRTYIEIEPGADAQTGNN